MKVNPEEITAILKREIEDYQLTSQVEEIGTVLSVGDGIAQVFGLTRAMAGELVTFESGVVGMILNLDEASVGVVLLGADQEIQEGQVVRRTGRIAEIPVGDAMIGRVVNALGEPLDQKGEIATTTSRALESPAPGVIDRKSVF